MRTCTYAARRDFRESFFQSRNKIIIYAQWRELYILSGSRTVVCCSIYAVLLPPSRRPFHRELQTESGTRQMTLIFIVFILWCAAVVCICSSHTARIVVCRPTDLIVNQTARVNVKIRFQYKTAPVLRVYTNVRIEHCCS